MKILHILYQSLPQISGSSIRSRDILMSQQEIGLNITAITSPFQIGFKQKEYINNILYYRTKINDIDSISDARKSFLKRVFRLFQIFVFAKELIKVIKKEKPDVLHAHAMFFCGLPALYLGWRFKIPVVYELRSLWMLSKIKRKKSIMSRLTEKLLYKIELFVMQNADIVIAINENLKAALVDSHIPSHKIKVIKNAVNTTLINDLKIKIVKGRNHNELNFGYIGTLTPHEGIDLLINSFEVFNLEYPNSMLYIYGNGIETVSIRKLIKGNKNVFFKGPISPELVYEAFGNIDIIVNPRYKNKLTDTITPLKPLEAMAYEKIVIGSKVGGIMELIQDNKNGFLFSAGDEKALLEVMKKVVNLDSAYFNKVKKEALMYVNNEKSWLVNAKEYKQIYGDLLN